MNSTKRFLFGLLVALSFFSADLAAATEIPSAPAQSAGPMTLMISYHVAPANRPALRKELEGAGRSQFQKWKTDGVLKDFRLLFNRFADSDNLDAFVVLSFSSTAQMQQWKKIEAISPAGLTAKARALTVAIHSSQADLVRTQRTSDTSADSVFIMIPYETLISAPDYLKYADAYVIPQFEGWMSEGILAHYGVYVNRYPAGRPWSTMLILEYKNEAALGARESVVAKVRAKLKENPEWKAISDSKKNIRTEKQIVIADQL